MNDKATPDDALLIKIKDWALATRPGYFTAEEIDRLLDLAAEGIVTLALDDAYNIEWLAMRQPDEG